MYHIMFGKCFCMEEIVAPLEVLDSLGPTETFETCSTVSGGSDADDILERDYDTDVTPLYRAIEAKTWDKVLYFLETGKWEEFSLLPFSRDDTPEVQARTWVTAFDEDGAVRWSQLPLHAAVCFYAPIVIVQKLLELYPMGIRCADDRDMLPLHVAFRFGARDNVIAFLISQFPAALNMEALKGRKPLDLARFGPNKDRGQIIQTYIQQAKKEAKKEWELEHADTFENAKDSKFLKKSLEEKQLKLKETETELTDTQEELNKLKEAFAAEKLEKEEASRSCETEESQESQESQQHQQPQQRKQWIGKKGIGGIGKIFRKSKRKSAMKPQACETGK